MVAINKCDKPGANPDKVRQRLMAHELIPEEYGGETIMTEVSALKGHGIDDLLESILLISEIGEYTAPVDRHAEGSVLEAKLEIGRGPVATILIKRNFESRRLSGSRKGLGSCSCYDRLQRKKDQKSDTEYAY